MWARFYINFLSWTLKTIDLEQKSFFIIFFGDVQAVEKERWRKRKRERGRKINKALFLSKIVQALRDLSERNDSWIETDIRCFITEYFRTQPHFRPPFNSAFLLYFLKNCTMLCISKIFSEKQKIHNIL